jgi:hypothetical protein
MVVHTNTEFEWQLLVVGYDLVDDRNSRKDPNRQISIIPGIAAIIYTCAGTFQVDRTPVLNLLKKILPTAEKG